MFHVLRKFYPFCHEKNENPVKMFQTLAQHTHKFNFMLVCATTYITYGAYFTHDMQRERGPQRSCDHFEEDSKG